MALTNSYQYIGRSNAVGCPSGWKYYILMYAKTTGSTATGKHTVSVKMRMACDHDSTFYNWRTTGFATVNGSNAFSWSKEWVPGTAWNSSSLTAGDYTYPRWVDLKEGSVEVNVGFGVTKDINISSSWVMNEVNSANWFPYQGVYANTSHTATLPMIAGASVPTVSASTVVMHDSVTIYTNRLSSSFTHDLTYSFSGSTGTIATGVGDSYPWTVPDLVSKIPGKRSGTCTITCKTKSGTTVIGTTYVDLTLTIPAESQPSASASTVKMGTSVDIYTNRNSTAYTHKLSYTIGSKSDVIKEDVEGDRTWTPLKSLAAYTGNKTSAVCTITCDTYNGTLRVGTKTTQIHLTVPDATVPSLSASSIELGKPITIYTPREADCYEHWISYTLKAYGSSTVVFTKDFDGAIQESYAWTPSMTMLAPNIPAATKGTITITCTTRFKDSTTVVGTAAPVSFTITIPNNSTTQPKVTMSLSPVSDLPSAFSGVYVAGKSKVKASYSASSDYSTIASYLTTANGSSGSTNPYTSALLNSSGTISITGKVTDARGYSTTKKSSITVIPYSRPRVIPKEGNSIVCKRCNSDGKEDPGGVYLLIQAGRKYEKVMSGSTQKNYCKLSYRYKTDAQDESQYSSPVTLLSRTATGDYVSKVISGVVTSNTTAYNIQLIAEDDIGETDTVTITVPTAFVTFHAPAGGHGFTLGGYHDPAKYDVFDCRFNAEFNGTVSGSVLGLLGCSGVIPANGDANDYKVPGVWAVQSNADAATIANLPPREMQAGLLRVYASTGQDYVTEGKWRYITQEYRSLYPGAPEYRRRLHTDGNGDWNYDNWVSGIDDIVHLAGTATQVNANIYTDTSSGVETCQFMIRAGDDYHVLNLTPSGMVYGKNGKVLWTK